MIASYYPHVKTREKMRVVFQDKLKHCPSLTAGDFDRH
jgi:hypothetical protein